jgi:hypothetical protein
VFRTCRAQKLTRLEMFRARSTFAARLEVQSSLAAPATRELGELFEYQISTPVTVRKSESAMLPFLQKIGARSCWSIPTKAPSILPTPPI